MEPNFFVIGPARCATESLYSYLKQHPQIYMSPIKETNWFVFYGQPICYRGPGDQRELESCYVPSLEAYEAQFAGIRDEIAVGEASPWYIYAPQVPERVKRDLPQAKFIAMLRNPVDRAYSAYGMLRLSQREPVGDFLRAFQLEQDRIDASWEPLWHYKSMGMYYEQIKRYYDCFGEKQLRVYLYDDFDARPFAVLRDVFRFLGVDDDFLPDISVRLNQSYVPKRGQLGSLLRDLVPSAARRRVRALVPIGAPAKASLDRPTRTYLSEVFREDVLRLQALLKRDLSAWLTC